MIKLFTLGIIGCAVVGIFLWMCYLIGNFMSKGTQSIEEDVNDGLFIFIGIASFLTIVLLVGIAIEKLFML